MFSTLPQHPKDQLFELTMAFRDDPRTEKIDLVLGVYRDETGVTPVMKSVTAAETSLLEASASKAYRALAGNTEFNDAMARLVLGDENVRLDHTAKMQTVGGTGALRLLGDLVGLVNPDATVWSTDPGYVNHQPIFAHAGLRVAPYRWQSLAGFVDIDAMLDDLGQATTGDVILLHGCCHNPTGIHMPLAGWVAIADLCASRGVIPLVDIAYQGFGDGLDEDALGLRHLAEQCETVLVASSCSKNMGLYCERAGAAFVLSPNGRDKARVNDALEGLTRVNYSMPAEHGAAIAAHILRDQSVWRDELAAVRKRVIGLRNGLADRLETSGAPANMSELRAHKGMFSTLPLTKLQTGTLRRDFAIYCTASGRINIAGLATSQLDYVAGALVAVTK